MLITSIFIQTALQGSDIAQEHCDLQVAQERVILHSIAGPTYINNQLVVVAQDWELRQGDILQFGDFMKFRFHNPMEAAVLREKRRSGGWMMHHSLSCESGGSNERISPAVSFAELYLIISDLYLYARNAWPFSLFYAQNTWVKDISIRIIDFLF